MGHTTRISDEELDRATTVSPDLEGIDVETTHTESAKSDTKAKVMTTQKKTPAKKSQAAKTK